MNDHTTKEQTQAEKDKAERIAANIDLLAAINGPPRSTPQQRAEARAKMLKSFEELKSLNNSLDTPFARP